MKDFEAYVRSELATLADAVRPGPDPYAALVRRRRWSLFRRGGLLAGVAALAAAGAGTFVALAPAGSPEPRPTYEFSGELGWKASVIDTPPRGAVAQDAAFRDDLAARVEALSRTRPGDPAFLDTNNRAMGEVDAWVIFGEDLGDRRVAAVALQRLNIADPRRRYPLTRVLWLAGPAGATPEQLLEGPDRQALDLAPAQSVSFGSGQGEVWVVLAPPECEVATSPVDNLDDWRAEPTGSYLVRTSGPARAENFRVACAGVVHEQWPGNRPAPTDAEVQALIADSGGVDADLDDVRDDLHWFRGQTRGVLTGPVRLLWAGPVTFAQPVHLEGRDAAHSVATGADVVVLTAPAEQGGWVVGAFIDVDQAAGNADYPWSPFYAVATDPTADDALLAARFTYERRVFALAPVGTRSVRLLDLAGTVVVEAPVAGRAALFPLPDGISTLNLRVAALDDRGRTIAMVDLFAFNSEVPGLNQDILLDWGGMRIG